jgi:hypothetical protein
LFRGALRFRTRFARTAFGALHIPNASRAQGYWRMAKEFSAVSSQLSVLYFVGLLLIAKNGTRMTQIFIADLNGSVFIRIAKHPLHQRSILINKP